MKKASMKNISLLVALILMLLSTVVACAPSTPTASSTPAAPSAPTAPSTPGDPSAELIEAAKAEGEVVIYSVTTSVGAMLQDFEALYPGIKVTIKGWDTSPLYEAMIEEAQGTPHDPDKSGTPVMGDLIWSSAMDLQLKLVAEGYAMPYDSPEAQDLPEWAKYYNLAWATTYEPIGFVYNKTLMQEADMPKTRAELIQMINDNPEKFDDKITAFDPEGSGLGYLLLAQDLRNNTSFWDLAKALKSSNVFAGTGTGAQFQRIQDGESLIGYDLLCSYAAQQSRNPDLKRPDLAFVLPEDYTLICSRVAFISKSAEHPNAAKLFLDYMLSKRGQEQLASLYLGSVRSDVTDDFTAAAIAAKLGDTAKPIPVSHILVDDLQESKRAEFLKQWSAAA